MGEYHNLCCKSCKISLNLGKKLGRDSSHLVLQGIYSDKHRIWLNDGRAWFIIQAFMQQHQGHELVFVSDTEFPQVQLYDYVEGDELLI